jgi:hypothetical protein
MANPIRAHAAQGLIYSDVIGAILEDAMAFYSRVMALFFVVAGSMAAGAAEPSSTMTELDQALNKCADSKKIKISEFLNTYAMDVRNEKNPNRKGQITHVDAPHLYYLTIFDEVAWKNLDQQWRTYQSQDPMARTVELANGLKAAFELASRASQSLPNLSHLSRFQSELSEMKACLNRAEVLKTQLQIDFPDQSLIANVEAKIKELNSFMASRSVQVFVLAPSSNLKVHKLNIKNIQRGPMKNGGPGEVVSYDAILGLTERGSLTFQSNDTRIEFFLNQQMPFVKNGHFSLNAPVEGDNLSNLFVSTKVAPKRLSENWNNL